ncbi:MAG TPA: zf-HC2 domain-containing protein [Pseudomonadales bacterium]|nr:zf-HC2 domain-containing protein [Pseudomonadales bacterium]
MGKKAVHEEVLEILPWFVNESLAGRERKLVLTHLTVCEECRSERDRLQALQQMVAEDVGGDIREYEAPLRRLMARINAAEANRASVRVIKRHKALPGWAPWMGIAASLFAVVTFVAMLNPIKPQSAEYRTLSNTTGNIGVPHRIALTFDQPIQADTLRAALIETQSNIVSGPDKRGTYIVEIRIPEGVSDARFLDSLRKIKGVRYAAFEGEATRRTP